MLIFINIWGIPRYNSVGNAGDIRTYLETCYRNNVNSFRALSRLTAGNPYTLAELLGEA